MSIAPSAQLSRFIPSFLIENPIYRDRGARTLLFALGVGYFLKKLISYGASVLPPLFYGERDLSKRYGKGSWALITGASDGIGLAFALELARRGFNIILQGRNRTKLEKAEQEVKIQHEGVQTRILVHDLSEAYKEGFIEEIFHEVRDLDISILVNNAGQMIIGAYYRKTIKEIRELLIVNCLAAALVLRVILPKLMLRTHKSAVINLSSKVASFPRPHAQIYAGSKAFIEHLSVGLDYEHSNVDFLVIKPGKVHTKLIGNSEPDVRTILPEELVKVALNYLGRTNDTYGHWKHKWDSYVTDIVPHPLRIYWFQNKYPELK